MTISTKVKRVAKMRATKPQLSSRLMIRLLNEQRDKLKARAAAMGVADSTLGRVYILEKLREPDA